MKLHILNMETARSRMIVEEELSRLGLSFLPVENNEIELTGKVSRSTVRKIKEVLAGYGLELIEERKSELIEKIKDSIIQVVQYADKPLKTNFSNYLSSILEYDYTYMANLFSSVQGITIERYIILRKIERVKELLTLGQLTLTEISYKLNYSSVAHLSNQFKKITGFTPSDFKRISGKK
jgi:AraC-like DNA-binding protein